MAEIKLRGVIHVHSRISYDGKESIARLAEFFRSRGYDFMCVTEHSDGLNREDMRRIVEECAGATGGGFVAVPGVEFSCRRRLHLLGIGVTEPVASHDPRPLAQLVRALGGWRFWRTPALTARRLRMKSPPCYTGRNSATTPRTANWDPARRPLNCGSTGGS